MTGPGFRARVSGAWRRVLAITVLVVVGGVAPGSPDDDAGIRQGDVVHEANRQAVTTAEELRAEAAKVAAGGTVLLRVERVQAGQASLGF